MTAALPSVVYPVGQPGLLPGGRGVGPCRICKTTFANERSKFSTIRDHFSELLTIFPVSSFLKSLAQRCTSQLRRICAHLGFLPATFWLEERGDMITGRC